MLYVVPCVFIDLSAAFNSNHDKNVLFQKSGVIFRSLVMVWIFLVLSSPAILTEPSSASSVLKVMLAEEILRLSVRPMADGLDQRERVTEYPVAIRGQRLGSRFSPARLCSGPRFRTRVLQVNFRSALLSSAPQMEPGSMNQPSA